MINPLNHNMNVPLRQIGLPRAPSRIRVVPSVFPHYVAAQVNVGQPPAQIQTPLAPNAVSVPNTDLPPAHPPAPDVLQALPPAQPAALDEVMPQPPALNELVPQPPAQNVQPDIVIDVDSDESFASAMDVVVEIHSADRRCSKRLLKRNAPPPIDPPPPPPKRRSKRVLGRPK